MELDSNAGCNYMLRWDNIFDRELAVELFWKSNLDIDSKEKTYNELENIKKWAKR